MDLKFNNQENELSIIEKMTQLDREATKVDFDQQSLSPDVEQGVKSLPPEVINDASNYNLENHLDEHLATRRVFFRKLSRGEIMKWTNTMISKPLLNINDTLDDSSIKCFKFLQSYMGDRKSSKKPLTHLKNHLRTTMWAPEDLKDEAYVQTLKQIKDHKDYDKAIRGWNFMAVLASCYAPSSDLYYSLLNYLIDESKNNTDTNIVKRANYIVLRLYRSYENKRKQIPTDEEIKHIENMKQIMFPIYFFSESNTIVPTESYSTVRELKTQIMRKLNLNVSRIPYYSLYEICKKQDTIEERFLDDMDKLVDIQSIWGRESDAFSKNNEQIDFKIYLKIQLYYNYAENDIDTLTMHYVQTCYDVNKGKFNLSELDIVTLASLNLMANHGNKSHEEINNILNKNPERYVPINKLKPNQEDYWTKKIMEFYISQQVIKRTEAKLTYLEHLKQNHLYEAHQYFAKFDRTLNKSEISKEFPDDLIIGIKPTGVTIQDMDRNEIIFLSYSKIVSWGVNNALVVIVLPRKNINDEDYPKYYFETNQSKMFQLLVESYTNLIVGKNITEVISSAYNSIKRFDSMSLPKNAKGGSARARSATQFAISFFK